MTVSNRICRAFLTPQAEIAPLWKLFSAISAFAGFVSGLRDAISGTPTDGCAAASGLSS